MNENPYAAPQADAPAPLNLGRIRIRNSPYGPYRKITWLHYTIVGLLITQMFITGAQLATITQLNDSVRAFDFDTGSPESIQTLENSSTSIARLSVAVSILTIIFWCIWTNKSCKNAWLFYSQRGLGGMSGNRPQTPGWAVGFYFIPIVQLWKPYQSMAFIRDQVSNYVKTGLLLGLWWTAWLIWTITSRILPRLNHDWNTIEGIISHNESLMVAGLIHIVASIPAAMVIHQLSKGQQRAANALATEAAKTPADPSEENGWKHSLPPVQ